MSSPVAAERQAGSDHLYGALGNRLKAHKVSVKDRARPAGTMPAYII